jgi:phosphate-selective porin
MTGSTVKRDLMDTITLPSCASLRHSSAVSDRPDDVLVLVTRRGLTLVMLGALALGAPVASAEGTGGSGIDVHYDEGLRFSTPDGNNAAKLELRGQLRYTNNRSNEPPGADDDADSDDLELNRARIKLGGHLYRPQFKFYWEQDIKDARVLDLRIEAVVRPWLTFRVGQHKVLYNRERVDSSGKQQFAERSIVNGPFTLDRQQGVTAMGRVLAETRFDSHYYLGAMVGAGRSGDDDHADSPMLVARWQWNFLGRELGFSQSDIGRHDQPAATISIGAARNRSAYTKFSSSGGGQLPGFEAGDQDRYELEQTMAEFALQYRGLSIQSEVHFKDIDDRVTNTRDKLSGFYLQAGYFFHERFQILPPPLELAVRIAQVDADTPRSLPDEDELTVAGNWFFSGHRNKLTADVSRLESKLPADKKSTWRFRLQWDLSI